MSITGPNTILFDVTGQATPVAIAYPNPDTTATTIVADAKGNLMLPPQYGGFGFRGTLAASKNNSAAIVLTTSYGTVSLAAGESTGILEGVDLFKIQTTGNNQLLHVMGQH